MIGLGSDKNTPARKSTPLPVVTVVTNMSYGQQQMPRDLVCPYIYLELSCYQRSTPRLALVQDPCKYFINMRTAESMDKINLNSDIILF